MTSVPIRTRCACRSRPPRIALAAVGVASILSCPARPDRLQFRAETIQITVHGDRCIVTGDYVFESHGDRLAAGVLSYPFPVAEDLPFPDSIAVVDLATGSPIRHTTTPEGIWFPVEAAFGDSALVRVSYVQHAPANRARYILTTTTRWGAPLRSADFVVRIRQGLELAHMSLVPDSLENAGAWRIYRIHKTHFMPVCDLDLTWKEVER